VLITRYIYTTTVVVKRPAEIVFERYVRFQHREMEKRRWSWLLLVASAAPPPFRGFPPHFQRYWPASQQHATYMQLWAFCCRVEVSIDVLISQCFVWRLPTIRMLLSLRSGDHSCIADKRDMHVARFLKACQHFPTPWLAENCGRLCG
jgi:hypothetical protein